MKYSFLLSLLFLGCSTPSSRDRIEAVRSSAHPHLAAISMDSFWMDDRSPDDRKVRHWEFYYKHCVGDEIRPYPDHENFVCTGPY